MAPENKKLEKIRALRQQLSEVDGQIADTQAKEEERLIKVFADDEEEDLFPKAKLPELNLSDVDNVLTNSSLEPVVKIGLDGSIQDVKTPRVKTKPEDPAIVQRRRNIKNALKEKSIEDQKGKMPPRKKPFFDIKPPAKQAAPEIEKPQKQEKFSVDARILDKIDSLGKQDDTPADKIKILAQAKFFTLKEAQSEEEVREVLQAIINKGAAKSSDFKGIVDSLKDPENEETAQIFLIGVRYFSDHENVRVVRSNGAIEDDWKIKTVFADGNDQVVVLVKGGLQKSVTVQEFLSWQTNGPETPSDQTEKLPEAAPLVEFQSEQSTVPVMEPTMETPETPVVPESTSAPAEEAPVVEVREPEKISAAKETEARTAITQEDLDTLFADFKQESGNKIELTDLETEEQGQLANILARKKSTSTEKAQNTALMEFGDLRKKITTRKLYQMLSSALDLQLNPTETSSPWTPRDISTEKIEVGNIVSYRGKEYRIAETPNEKNRFKFVLVSINPKDLTQRIDSIGLENLLYTEEAQIKQYSEASLKYLEKGLGYSSKFFNKIKKDIEAGRDEKSVRKAIKLFEELFDHEQVWKTYPDSDRARRVADKFESQASELKRIIKEREDIQKLREQYGDEYANLEIEKRALKRDMAELRKLIESLED